MTSLLTAAVTERQIIERKVQWLCVHTVYAYSRKTDEKTETDLLRNKHKGYYNGLTNPSIYSHYFSLQLKPQQL